MSLEHALQQQTPPEYVHGAEHCPANHSNVAQMWSNRQCPVGRWPVATLGPNDICIQLTWNDPTDGNSLLIGNQEGIWSWSSPTLCGNGGGAGQFPILEALWQAIWADRCVLRGGSPNTISDADDQVRVVPRSSPDWHSTRPAVRFQK